MCNSTASLMFRRTSSRVSPREAGTRVPVKHGALLMTIARILRESSADAGVDPVVQAPDQAVHTVLLVCSPISGRD